MRSRLLMTLPLLLFVGCASDGIRGERPACPAYPDPNRHVVGKLDALARADTQVGTWWVDHNQFVARCDAINRGG